MCMWPVTMHLNKGIRKASTCGSPDPTDGTSSDHGDGDPRPLGTLGASSASSMPPRDGQRRAFSGRKPAALTAPRRAGRWRPSSERLRGKRKRGWKKTIGSHPSNRVRRCVFPPRSDDKIANEHLYIVHPQGDMSTDAHLPCL